MYLPQEAHKSFTATFVALGGVVSRTATNAVKNGSQTADKLSIIPFLYKKKGLDSSFFTFRENY